MKFKDILTISGQPGLYMYLAPGKNGLIVESVEDKRRMNASGSAKISSLAEISIYTDEGEMPLSEVFTAIRKHTSGQPAPSHKADPDQLKKFFGEALPGYDRDRVRVSDMKKAVSWYNILTAAGMDDFSIEEEPAQEEGVAAQGKKE